MTGAAGGSCCLVHNLRVGGVVAFGALVIGLAAYTAIREQNAPEPSLPEGGGGILLTQDGLNELLLGGRDGLSLSITDVESWLGQDLFLAPQTGDCTLAIDEDLGIAVLTDEKNGVMGFVLDNPQITTPEGIQVGSTAADLEAAYGEAIGVVEGALSHSGGPLALVDDSENPGSPPGPNSRHLAFDTDEDGAVTRLKAGYWPWMGYTDYCSPESDNPQNTGWPVTRT